MISAMQEISVLGNPSGGHINQVEVGSGHSRRAAWKRGLFSEELS